MSSFLPQIQMNPHSSLIKYSLARMMNGKFCCCGSMFSREQKIKLCLEVYLLQPVFLFFLLLLGSFWGYFLMSKLWFLGTPTLAPYLHPIFTPGTRRRGPLAICAKLGNLAAFLFRARATESAPRSSFYRARVLIFRKPGPVFWKSRILTTYSHNLDWSAPSTTQTISFSNPVESVWAPT